MQPMKRVFVKSFFSTKCQYCRIDTYIFAHSKTRTSLSRNCFVCVHAGLRLHERAPVPRFQGCNLPFPHGQKKLGGRADCVTAPLYFAKSGSGICVASLPRCRKTHPGRIRPHPPSSGGGYRGQSGTSGSPHVPYPYAAGSLCSVIRMLPQALQEPPPTVDGRRQSSAA